MNPLTHAYFALELFKGENLTSDQKDHLLVGSLLPDLHVAGLIQFQKTHTQSLAFFRSLNNPLHKFLALGMVLHGEHPQGLDFYTHKDQGYIHQKKDLITPLARQYKKQIGKINGMTHHHLTEFAAELLIAEKDPTINHQILAAFKNPKIKSAITAFSNFFGFSERKNRKILSLIKNKFLHNFFLNFSLPETASQNWLNLTFYMNLKEGKNLPFRQKMKKLTHFSYYNIKRKFSHKKTAQLFQDINSHLRKDFYDFLETAKKEVKPLKKELLKSISSPGN